MNPEDHAGSLAHFDASREKIDPGLKSGEAYASRLGRRGINRDRNLGVVQIDGIQCRFLLEQIGVIDVQGEIADLGKDRLPAIVVVDLEILGDQTPKRIQGQAPNPDFETEGMEFFGQARLANVFRTLDDSNSRRPTKAAESGQAGSAT